MDNLYKDINGIIHGRDPWQEIESWLIPLTPEESAIILGQNQSAKDLRKQIVFDINKWRDGQEQENILFTHAGRNWDGGTTSKSRMDATLALTKAIGTLPSGFFWTSADDLDIPMNLVELESLAESLYAARGLRGFEIHSRQRQMKAEVEALTTIEALQAYPIGWSTEEPA